MLMSGLEQYGDLIMYPVGIRTHCIFFGICNFLLVISRLKLGRVRYIVVMLLVHTGNKSVGSLRASFTQNLS